MFYMTTQTAHWEFRCYASTGALVNADSLPTAILVADGVDTLDAVTVTNPSTGRYKVSCALSGRTVGQTCYFVATAIVNTVTQDIVQQVPFMVASANLAALLGPGGTLTITQGVVINEHPVSLHGVDIITTTADSVAVYMTSAGTGVWIEADTGINNSGYGCLHLMSYCMAAPAVDIQSQYSGISVTAIGGDGIYLSGGSGGAGIHATGYSGIYIEGTGSDAGIYVTGPIGILALGTNNGGIVALGSGHTLPSTPAGIYASSGTDGINVSGGTGSGIIALGSGHTLPSTPAGFYASSGTSGINVYGGFDGINTQGGSYGIYTGAVTAGTVSCILSLQDFYVNNSTTFNGGIVINGSGSGYGIDIGGSNGSINAAYGIISSLWGDIQGVVRSGLEGSVNVTDITVGGNSTFNGGIAFNAGVTVNNGSGYGISVTGSTSGIYASGPTAAIDGSSGGILGVPAPDVPTEAEIAAELLATANPTTTVGEQLQDIAVVKENLNRPGVD